MTWKITKIRREWAAWSEDRARFRHAWAEVGHATVNIFVEAIRHHAYTLGHVVVLVGLIALGWWAI